MTKSGFAQQSSYSVFESFRPGSGQTVDRLAIATYSVDLVAIAALLLSLGKAGEEELEAGPLSFVDALEQLAPRLDIVYQKGRLIVPDKHHKILHVLDRRLHAIQPPRFASYHPKLFLARYRGGRAEITWRLWVGSRNLTGGEDREAGIFLIGAVGGGRGARQSDVAAMAADLLAPLEWISRYRDELANVRWRTPSDVKFRGLQWRRPGEMKPFKTVMQAPLRTLAISPFVDEAGGKLVFTKSGINELLTTQAAAGTLVDVLNAQISVEKPPLFAPPMPLAGADQLASEEAPETSNPPGIHAKLLLRQNSSTSRLWIGSANLTRRGMLGPNAEVFAELDVLPQIAQDLFAYFESRPPATRSKVDPADVARQAAERELDDAIRAVLDADFRLSRSPEGLKLTTDAILDDFLEAHRLQACLLTRPDARIEWSLGDHAVLLVPGAVPLYLETVLVCFSAERRAGDCGPRHWAQGVAFPEHNVDQRDRKALAAYIGIEGAGAWLRAQLQGILPTEPLTWSGAHRGRHKSDSGTAQDRLPFVLEEVLAAWARNPNDFEARINALREMVVALHGELQGKGDAWPLESVRQWEEIERFFRQVSQSIGERNGP